MHKLLRVALLAATLLSFAGTAASAAKDAALPARFQKWLDEVAVLITPPERQAFLALREDARRDAFIAAFWNARDPDPAHPDGSFRATYYARREQAKERFRSLTNDAAKVFIISGEPADVYRMDCGLAFWPLEIWYYRTTPHTGPVSLLFYRPAGGPVLVRWHAEDGTDFLMAIPVLDKDPLSPLGAQRGTESATGHAAWRRLVDYIHRFCRSDEDADRLLAVLNEAQTSGRGAVNLVETPPLPDPEWLGTFAAGSTDAPSAEARDPLSPDELRWLDEVTVLISPAERRAFQALRRSYQRAGFVEAFWKARDPNPKTPDNEARAIFEARVETVRQRWKSLVVDTARVYLLNGEPVSVLKTDCNGRLWPIEIWHYAYSDRSRRPFELLFFQSGEAGPFRLWHVEQGYAVLQRVPTPDVMANPNPRTGFGLDGEFAPFYRRLLEEWCPVEARRIVAAMRKLEQGDRMLADVIEQAPPVDLEWLASYRTFSTDVAAAAKPLDAELAVDYPGRHQSRTLVRGTLRVPSDAGGGANDAGSGARAFSLIGEVLREAALHESFRYYFQLVAPAADGSYPLVFERFLRPGDFRLVLKLEDALSGRAVRIVRELAVPAVAETAAAAAGAANAASPPLPGAEGFRLLAPATDLVSGVVRIDAEVGDARVREVAFSVDGKPILVRRRPPWSVELRLGELPRSMRVRAVARDAAGEVVAADEVQLNPAPHRFAVRLVEPREGSPAAAGAARGSLRVRAAVQVPPDQTLDRLELFLDETAVATLFQEPWEAVVSALPTPPPTFLRALAHLTDGTTAEDVVLLAGGDVQRGTVEVDLVEVYTAALDAQGRPVHDLAESDFLVREDGRRQELRRFQRVTDLPLQVGLLVDTSASMAEMLPKVQEAALQFFREALAPKDRAAVVTFSEEPRLAAPFTRDLDRLGAALVGLQAARGTALWDSLVYALHYFQGTSGRRALLVFSDGADRGSRFTFDQALAYAQHSGVSVYAVSFGGAASALLEGGRRRLANLAEATGGRSFVLGGTDELDATYRAIDEDLRSQYLLVYQSDGQGETFRAVEVEVRRPGVTARTMRGYIP